MLDALAEIPTNIPLGIEGRSSIERYQNEIRVLHPSSPEKLKDLPIGQVIKIVYGHTPELQWISKANRENEEETKKTARSVRESIKNYYGLKVKYLKDEKLLEKTKNPKNKATLKGKTIYMAESLKDNPWEEIQELAHELGTYRLLQIYGSKENIPTGLPNLWGEKPRLAATHYLDELIFQGGPSTEEGKRIIEIARQYQPVPFKGK